VLLFCRGDEFRQAFSKIGELRSIIPDHVHLLALTATATKDTYQVVCSRLSLVDPVVIGLSPDRPNLMLNVVGKPSINEYCKQLSQDFKLKRMEFPKTIIFCHNYQDVSDMYTSLIRHLGTNKTEPPGYPNVLKFRVVMMYSRATTTGMKEKIISAFIQQRGSVLRIVIATTAHQIIHWIGVLGLNCPDVHQIIHWGPSSDLEHYVQEIGRAGRDGIASKAILMFKKANRFTTKAMKSYVVNKNSCRRRTLYSPFINYEHRTDVSMCNCCDNCALCCKCNVCKH